MIALIVLCFVFFFEKKTAYEMRISYWSSDVCSSDLIRDGIAQLWQAMQDCLRCGLGAEGSLPGGLHVARRAPMLYRDLGSRPEAALRDPLTVLDWVNLYALAVNEENAAGGRVVTAPTNGAAGIIPAVLHYYDRFCAKSNDNEIGRAHV